MFNDETSDTQDNSLVNSLGVNRSRMLAEKLVFSYPFGKVVLSSEKNTHHRVSHLITIPTPLW